MNNSTFDVIVIGGGHAGIEAAYVASRMGSKTVLITLDISKIGSMPCNPAIGGIGKGHIVFEISALGGLMPQLCTHTYLQARMLNTRKGPAVQGLRLQIDKEAYSALAIEHLSKTPNLTLHTAAVDSLLHKNNHIIGVKTEDNKEIYAPCVVITTGTFLNGRVHVGLENRSAGRRDERAVSGLSTSLQTLGLEIGRLKTGTPPRLATQSVDFSQMTCQESDKLEYLFEFKPHAVRNTQPCHITYTNEKSHEVIRKNLNKSPMYVGNITGKAPRYCPSIEDKIARFPEKISHQIFVEPETATGEEVYPNGISTSLPFEIQEEFIRTIKGFEHAKITKPGYAVEYDFVLPHQLDHTLQVKGIRGLFLAGQINGTTGYEEAAGQGILAGINAHLQGHNLEPCILSREQSYIGVMVDDLVTLGIDEPYRMFTSRAERRLVLRQGNTFYRLADLSYKLGLMPENMYKEVKGEHLRIESTLTLLNKKEHRLDLLELLERDEENVQRLHELTNNTLNNRCIQELWAEIRYRPYLAREQKEIEKAQKYRSLSIPEDFSFIDLPGLSKELQQKLSRTRPKNIAQAGLIQGMTPAAISLLIFKVNEFEKQRLR